MPDSKQPFDDTDAPEGPSKSELKRRMLALQELGEALVNLSPRQLAKIQIEDQRLLEAVNQARGMKSRSARRRQLQLIGKLMRDIDHTPIQNALEKRDQLQQQETDSFHELEQLRDAALAAGMAGVDMILERWPGADRQQLRQLILQHQRESQRGKPPAASRKLFRLLRSLSES